MRAAACTRRARPHGRPRRERPPERARVWSVLLATNSPNARQASDKKTAATKTGPEPEARRASPCTPPRSAPSLPLHTLSLGKHSLSLGHQSRGAEQGQRLDSLSAAALACPHPCPGNTCGSPPAMPLAPHCSPCPPCSRREHFIAPWFSLLMKRNQNDLS